LRIWIDTDIGSDVDDALALGYALRHPKVEVEIVLVSTVFGDVALRSRIAEAVLERAGAEETPVITGLSAPLSPGRERRMFGHEGIGLFAEPAPRMVTKQDEDPRGRVEAMAHALEQTQPDAVLAIGPMTNLGALVEAGVALPPVTVMGGKTTEVLHPGMIKRSRSGTGTATRSPCSASFKPTGHRLAWCLAR
jgi:purine nucleosidase